MYSAPPTYFWEGFTCYLILIKVDFNLKEKYSKKFGLFIIPRKAGGGRGLGITKKSMETVPLKELVFYHNDR